MHLGVLMKDDKVDISGYTTRNCKPRPSSGWARRELWQRSAEASARGRGGRRPAASKRQRSPRERHGARRGARGTQPRAASLASAARPDRHVGVSFQVRGPT
jgi:hypothetical protein